METKTRNQNYVFNAYELIRFAWDKKWILIALSTLALILSVIYSLSIKPRFKSEVILFPASTVSISKHLLETNSLITDSRDALSFGGEEDAERLLQILNSDQIKDHIARKFNLMKHYRIDSTEAFPRTQLYSKFKGNVKARRTEYMSIQIAVLDEDPQMAADIANTIVSYVDSTIRNMQHNRAMEALAIVEDEYLHTRTEVQMISDSLQKIRRLGVIDYDSQAKALNTAYANALAQGNKEASELLLKRINILATYGGTYVELSKKLDFEIERLKELKIKYASNKLNTNLNIPHMFIVDKATKAERKAVPKRSIIVAMSMVSTFALALLLLLVLENIKRRT
jgi:uncharacterized protein involved in exopolysaccharide biosynthesis